MTAFISDFNFFPPSTLLLREEDQARIYVSRDGGATWGVSSLRYWRGGLPTTLGTLQFATPSDGWAIEQGGTALWRTRSAGQTWSPLPQIPAPHENIVKFFFLDTTRGWAVRTDRGKYQVIATTSGGQAWEDAGQVLVPSGKLIERLWFLDSLTGWALESGLGGQLHRTTDGGQTWQRQAFGVDPAVHEVVHAQFVDRLKGWAVTNGRGIAGMILRTADGGQTWQSVPHPARVFNLDGLWFLTPTEGWVVGERSTILKTTDGGQTWTEIDDDLKAARRTSPLRRQLDRLLGR